MTPQGVLHMQGAGTLLHAAPCIPQPDTRHLQQPTVCPVPYRPNTDRQHSLFKKKAAGLSNPMAASTSDKCRHHFVGCGLRLTTAHPNNFPAQTVLECRAQREGTHALLKTACVDRARHDAA